LEETACEVTFLDSIYALYTNTTWRKNNTNSVLFEEPWNAEISHELYRNFVGKIFWIPNGHNYGIAESQELHMMI